MKTRQHHDNHDHDPIPADLLFSEPMNSPFAAYARRERAEINRELRIFDEDCERADWENARLARGLLSCRGM